MAQNIHRRPTQAVQLFVMSVRLTFAQFADEYFASLMRSCGAVNMESLP
jgi:hypothetical protein